MYALRPAIFTLASLTLLGLAAVSPAHAQANLFVNGDFSQGNTGFQVGSAYSFITPPSTATTLGQYGVGTNPSSYSTSWASFGDHTTGTGNMLLVDASTTANQFIWQETVSGLTVGTQYTFSGFVASNNPGEPSPAVIELAVGGTQLGATTTAPTQAGVFVPFSATYVPTATSATFQIYDTNTVYAYNDFAVDDISLKAPAAVPEASTTVSFGLLLALGLGGAVLARKKKGVA